MKQYILWCNDGKHDKVWGVIQIGFDADNVGTFGPKKFYYENKYVTFWGRRGSKLQTKIWASVESFDGYMFKRMIEQKKDKGYKIVNKSELDKVYPEFQQDLEKTAFWATLKM